MAHHRRRELEHRAPLLNAMLQLSLPYLTRGSCSHWWNGGGDGNCHSSVVAPSPHGLAAASRFLEKALEDDVEEDQHAKCGNVRSDG